MGTARGGSVLWQPATGRQTNVASLGTVAWFFLGVNRCKVPLSAGLGLFDRDMALTSALLAPLVLAGRFAGIAVASRVKQRSFDIGSAVRILCRDSRACCSTGLDE